MTTTKRFWTLALSAALGFTINHAQAGTDPWRPAAAVAPAAVPTRPTARIGRPIALTDGGVPAALPALSAVDIAQAEPIPATWSEEVIIRAQATDAPPVPPPGAAPVPYALDPTVKIDEPIGGSGSNGGFWNSVTGWSKHCTFRSDHAFDGMVSPVSNPFFFEDPRSLTEVKPLFIYQSSPSSTPVFSGGHSEFFGLQARVALNERWSVVMNKLGFVSLHPNDPIEGIASETGFAEFDIGPKWTFLRNENSGSVVAAGLTFEIPTGIKAEQNTGTLGLDPYITYAQSFGHLPQGYGSFNFMSETGYSFSVDNKRSQFLHSSLHLDYDVANLHRFYPLVELNWFHTTRSGTARDLTFEGGDLVNFGSSNVSSLNLVTMDLGARYKYTEWLQFGGAIEFPVSSRKDLTDYRFLFDVIFRY